MPYHVNALERLRDHTFRRLPVRAVRDQRSALRFVNEVGFCSVFTNRARHYPCLWVAVCGRRDPAFPHHTHFDPELSLTWRLKDALPARKKVLYCRVVGSKPAMVALDLIPQFVALSGPQHDEQHLYDYEEGKLSREARDIVEALLREHPMPTRDVKQRVRLPARSPGQAFARAMAELQHRLYVTMVEVRYEPSFTYVWECVEHRFPPQVAAGRALARREALAAIIPRHLSVVYYTQERALARLLGATPEELEPVLGDLATAGKLDRRASVRGLPGKWLVWRRA